MRISVEIGDIAARADEAIAVDLFAGVSQLGGATGAVDRAIGGALSELIRAGDLTGKFREVFLLPTLGKIPSKRVVVVGLGEREALSLDRAREASAAVAVRLRDLGIHSFSTIVHGTGNAELDARPAAEAVVEGALMGLYRFLEHKTEKETKRIDSFTIVTRDREQGRVFHESVHTASVVAATVNWVRDLINAPSNAKTPRMIADKVRVAAKEAGASATVYDEARLDSMRFGGLLGVAKGSAEPPRFVVLEHHGGGTAKPIVLVGKGITFDTGGISLKPQEGPTDPIWVMKYDMSGAAAVLGAVLAAAKLKVPVNVVALAPLTENMPGGRAQKPGDVLTAYGGKTVEVLNTDAEGRLVLADALEYAKTLNPEAVIDLATLTGAAKIALGRMAAAMFGTDASLKDRIRRAGEATDERVWELPLWPDYDELIKSEVADVKNVGGKSAGAIAAASFLRRFAEGPPWAHLDIAGPAWVESPPESPRRDYAPKGASGWGVRLLVRMLRDWSVAG